jgi:hypothetical protein
MLPLVVALIGALWAAFWFVACYRRVASTTLAAPLAWLALSLAAVSLTEAALVLLRLDAARSSVWRYAAAVGTFCPMMALLGAKRPQDRGWQFIVATLWLVLLLPAAQSFVFAPASRLELHGAWRAFLMLQIAVGLTNYLATRYALSAVLFAVGQVLLLHAQLPIAWPAGESSAVAAAIVSLVAATATAGARAAGATRGATWSDRVWLDFRDAFGAVWALRVMERINQAARQSRRSDVLGWHGFRDGWDPLAERDATQESLAMTIRMLLRRFVDTGWLDRRRRDTVA